MDGMFPGNLTGNESNASSSNASSSNLHDNEVIPWYFSREEIEKNSPSRRDGIDWKKESRLRMAYCTFLIVLGDKLKVPLITIVTAIVFCQRFFIRQSHAKNDSWTIATVCMFLAAKVEESSLDLKDIFTVSYEIRNKKDLDAAKRKELYDQQKEHLLSVEKLVLSSLNFDLSLHHPFKSLVEAIKKNIVEEDELQFSRLASRFFYDCIRTSLCLQYKPDHIAAGIFFLAAERLKMDFQLYGKGLCQKFDITPSQLEDIHGQLLEFYEINPFAGSREIRAENIEVGDDVNQPVSRDMVSTDKCPSSVIEGGSSKVNLSESDDHSVQDRSRSEEIGKENSESEAGETSTDVGVSQMEKELLPEKSKQFEWRIDG